jgi:hypothetical protein
MKFLFEIIGDDNYFDWIILVVVPCISSFGAEFHDGGDEYSPSGSIIRSLLINCSLFREDVDLNFSVVSSLIFREISRLISSWSSYSCDDK